VHHLAEARKALGGALTAPPSLVDRYADFASTVYAPVQREGRFPDSCPRGQEVETSAYQAHDVGALGALEASMPRGMTHARIQSPTVGPTTRRTRREAAEAKGDLEHVAGLLDASKRATGRGFGDCWPFPLPDDALPPAAKAAKAEAKRIASRRSFRFTERPETPTLASPAQAVAHRAALVLVQRLLRGRAAQDRMYVGRARRAELIRELQLSETSPSRGPRPDDLAPPARRADALVGHAIAELCAVMASGDAAARGRLMADLAARAAAYKRAQEEAEEAEAREAEEARRLRAEEAAAAAAEKDAAEQEEAARKIQAIQRGRIARQRADEVKKKAAEEAAAVEALRRKPSIAVEYSPEMQAAAAAAAMAPSDKGRRVPARGPSNVGPPKLAPRADAPPEDLKEMFFTTDMEAAALKIQAAHRGKATRRRLEAMRAGQETGYAEASDAGATLQQMATAAGVEVHQLDDFSEEQEAAALKIQAIQRGRQARREVAALRAAGPATQQAVLITTDEGRRR